MMNNLKLFFMPWLVIVIQNITIERNNHELTILIDGRSTPNFIQDRIVKFLGLITTPSTSFNVMVGNEDHLCCNSVCKHVPII